MADLPRVAVQVGFDVSGTPQNVGSDYTAITWTDVTAAVRAEPALTFTRGRPEAGQPAAAGQLSVTLLNDDGDFTPGDNGGAYGAIHTRMPIRVVGDAGGYSSDYSAEYAHSVVLWVGFITDIDWALDSGQPVVTITASDIIAAAARTTCGPWLDSRITRATAAGLVGYWPLTDPAPNGLGNSSSNSVPMLGGEYLLPGYGTTPITAYGATGDLSVNVATGGLSPDNQPNVAFTQDASGTLPKYLEAVIPNSSTDVAIGLWMRRTREVSATPAVPLAIDTVATNERVLQVNDYLSASEDGLRVVLTPTPTLISVPYGQWFHVYIRMTSSQNILYVNGVLTATVARDEYPPVTFGALRIQIGAHSRAYTGIYSFTGQIAHVGIWNTHNATRPAILADRGASQSPAYTRFSDLVYLTPNPTGLATWLASDSDADNVVSAQAVKGKSLLTVAQEVADADRGSIIAQADGKLALLAQRATVAPATATLTLSAETDILAIDGLFGVDDADNINEVTVTLQPSGRVLSATRSADPGIESTAVELWSTDEVFAQSLATALANADTQTPRAPSLTLSMDWLAYAGLADEAVGLELGDTLTITDLPAAAPASSLTVQIRAITHTIGRDAWTVQVDTDPPLRRGVLDDTDLGILDDTLILGV